MKNTLAILLCSLGLTACHTSRQLGVTPSTSDLRFDHLPTVWDEALPLGNATVGALVWQKDSVLRMSLDRIDLWDLRPLDSLSGPHFRFSWVYDQVQRKNYGEVQRKFDVPYDQKFAPSKIPGAALEFPVNLGKVASARLYLNNALGEVVWENGTRLQTFVHATAPVGWFVFDQLPDGVTPRLVPPRYADDRGIRDNDSHAGPTLKKLGYEQGEYQSGPQCLTYHQPGWNGSYYDVAVRYEQKGKRLVGTWSITSSMVQEEAKAHASAAMERGVEKDYADHLDFWNPYWAQSSVTLPDSVLQKQYDNEMYKFGSATREHSYPISLQSVWTADNGLLPPWKGDFHHDLNTQLSYWPAYIGNHLKEGMGYLNTLWNQREVYKKYTKQYFGTDGMNIPGVCTLTGEPMGGWIQYAMSPTISAWLSHHFYQHWKYSADSLFLKEKGYPFMKDVAVYLEQVSAVDGQGIRRLPLSSSPEVNDNSIKAWFPTMTNYDLALMKFAFGAAAEMADSLRLTTDAAHWREVGAQLPDFDLDAEGALTIAKGHPYRMSHRHFSHAMGIHPLGLIDWSQGEASQRIIKATIDKLDHYGPDWWCGYSYSWLGNLKARAFDGEGAARALRTFATCFCLPNTFHANGDQTRSGKSRFTYRPFTLEGNFAFAAGIQEMLLQSHTGMVRLFPAIPKDWKNVSFRHLRAMGGFVISAEMKNGRVVRYDAHAEQDGVLRLVFPEGSGIENTAGKNYKEIPMKKHSSYHWAVR